MSNYKGKAIYQPAGKAAEYSRWAVNFFVGCSAACTYCYNRHGITAKVLGADKPTLKKSLVNEDTALQIFIKEADINLTDLRKHGLFFNFVSDPFLPETIVLNTAAIQYCLIMGIPVKVLTKQTWWLETFLQKFEEWIDENVNRQDCKDLIAFGFTLTGHDELEPGAAPNTDRIRAMKVLHAEGFKTWASIEPIIDCESSLKMIFEICDHVDLIKIGLQSGQKYNFPDLYKIITAVKNLTMLYDFKVYYKDSFIRQTKINRSVLPDSYVRSDYSLFHN